MYIKKKLSLKNVTSYYSGMSEYKYIDRLKEHILGFVKTAYIDTEAFPIH